MMSGEKPDLPQIDKFRERALEVQGGASKGLENPE
jgi:hypothetical protein